MLIISIFICLWGSPVGAKNIKIDNYVWTALTLSEQKQLSDEHTIEVYDATLYGKIIDVQGVDESHKNNGAMSELGSLLGQAQYLDKHNWKSYSAKEQVGAALLGGLVGGMLDKPSTKQIHLRYTIQMNNGEIRTKDIIQKGDFHHSKGLCVDIDRLVPVNTCFCENLNIDKFRLKYLKNIHTKPSIVENSAIKKETGSKCFVKCKLGTSAPFRTTKKKCNLIKGRILE